MKNEFSSSEVAEYNKAECDWLHLNTIYCDSQSSGVTGDNNIESDVDEIFEDTKMNTEVEMLTPYTKLAPLVMLSEDEEDTEEILTSWNRTESMRDNRSKESIKSDVNDNDVFMNKSSGVTGDDEIFESDVYDDDVVVSWSTARESPGVTGDNAKHRESIEQCILLENYALIQSKEKLYSLMATNMDAYDPEEYCSEL